MGLNFFALSQNASTFILMPLPFFVSLRSYLTIALNPFIFPPSHFLSFYIFPSS